MVGACALPRKDAKNAMKSKNPYFTELNILIKKCFKEGPPKTRAKGKGQPLAMTSNRNAFF